MSEQVCQGLGLLMCVHDLHMFTTSSASFLTCQFPMDTEAFGRPVAAAMALSDGAASVEKRCKDIDNTGSLLDELKAQHVKSFSALAFTTGTPWAAPTEKQ